MNPSNSPTKSNGAATVDAVTTPCDVNESHSVYINPNPTFSEIARPWVARGFKVIPVARGAKRPVWTGWPQISETNTVDQMQALCDNDRRFARWNCGLMADPSFHCVLDCDSLGLVEQIERETGRKIPETLTVKSAGKGCPHFYFLPTPKSRELNNKSAVSTEGHSFDFWVWHQQTLAPGSIKEPSGSRYQLVRDVPMVPIPDWLVDWIAAQHRAHSDASGDADAGALGQLKAAYQRNLNPEDMYNIDGLAIDSCQHPTIHSLACFIWDGERSEEDMVEILETVWTTYCSRDYERATSDTGLSEIERIVQNVMEKEPCLPNRTSGGPIFGKTVKQDGLPAPQRRRFSHADLLARVSAEPEPQIIDGLLGIRAQAIAVGESTIGKTPLFLQMALCVANGVPFMGMPVKQGRVMILDYENEETPLADMLGALSGFLGTTSPVDAGMLQIVTSPGSQKEAFAEVADFKPALVIVDSLRGFDPLAETKSDAAALMFEKLKRFETAWLIIHHPRKDSTDSNDKKVPLDAAVRVVDWLQAASGTRALINQSSTRIAVDSPGPAIPGELLMRWNLKGLGDKGPLYISREVDGQGDPAGYQKLTGADLMKNEHQALLRTLLGSRKATPPMHFRDVQSALVGTKPKQIARFLDAAIDVGVASVDGKARSKNRVYTFQEGAPVNGSFSVGY